ncbi:MAG: prephenate dehydrogenase/arogenate dehydrogenase family protein [Eggerthellaceae bacterium]|nr:prephenate dehydrogenase/arogenate dehydrogenase family protein [Eggerthellaceae bacterium]
MEMEGNVKLERAVVVGLGLIGASFAAAFKRAVPDGQLLGVDIDRSTCYTALSKGWVNEACGPEDDLLRTFACDGCQLVVLATPASAACEYLKMLDGWGYSGIITDTASTKDRICKEASEVLARPELFIPGHPMAGSEVNGIEGARPDLFEGAHWILCPDANTPPENFTALHELLVQMKARIVSLRREDHDRAIAVVSHVPHIVAASLVELATRHADEQQALFRLAAGGFKDSTRIAAGSPKLWCGISFDNRNALRDGLDEMRQILGQFQEALEGDDRQRMFELLDETARARRALPVRWVPSTDNLVEVRVPMENRKGVVAQATTIASQVGCNIQSIEIDHITADSAVLSMILTDEGDIGKLSMQLIGAGFTVSLSPLSAKEYAHVD